MTPSTRDPRPIKASEADIRPVVTRYRASTPIWLVAGIAVLSGVLLFSVLDGQRRARTAPATQVRTVDGVRMPSALPPLYIAPESIEVPPPPPPPPPGLLAPNPPFQPTPPQAQPFVPQPPPPIHAPAPAYLPQPPMPEVQRPTSGGAVLVIDTTATPGGAATGAGDPVGSDGSMAASAAVAVDPVRTTRLGRRATIVPQGTLIPAVLETALDSTRPGQVRAMVSRDVTGFDGSQVLIPRGSRLFGEYQADLAPGQNRAFVQWTRLVRPDGVSIAIASPAADRVGRAGIRGRVDSHFLARFGAAVLQSTLNLGLGWAGRNIGGDSSVIVALPGAGQGASAPLTGSQARPTLRVDAGVTVTVFVARDLEFPPTGSRR